MADWTDKIPQEARDYINGRRIEEVECIVADIAGMARGKTMPASKFGLGQRMFMPESIYYQTITGDWAEWRGSSWVTEPDHVMTPDFATARAAPWADDVTIQIIHDVHDRDGNPAFLSPRNVLKRVVGMYHDRGWSPVVAPEMEFYLVARNTDPTQPIEPPMGRSGRRAASRQAYSISAVDEYGPVIDDIYDFAEVQGLEIDGITQEGGAGQVEINLKHGDPIALADEIFFFKRLIREAALRHNCYATFMAKPMQDEPGSAMHIHHSVTDTKTGKNIFSDPKGDETPAFRHFIAGLQNHLPSVISFLAPYVNSYRRYVPDFSAPINLEWGRDNRTTGLRIPISDPDARRVENRLGGMDCNPYLGIAASLACGLLGMIEQQEPRPEIKGDGYISDDIAKGLGDAIAQLGAASAIRDVLGRKFCEAYASVKQSEYSAFMHVISPWEREHLLLNV